MSCIRVEFGTLEQKRQIEGELRSVFSLAETLDPPVKINRIVVPQSFDEAVNRLQGDASYRSTRNAGQSTITVQAKVIYEEDGFSLVVSPYLFTADHDFQTRMITYTHELVHLLNDSRFDSPHLLNRADQIYFDNLFVFADEYFADRKAFELLIEAIEEQSDLFKTSIQSQAGGIEQLLMDPSHKVELRRRSREVYVHRDVARYLKDVMPIFDALFVNTAHAFSIEHSIPSMDLLSRIRGSEFITDATMQLVSFIRNMYEDENYELSDGIGLAKEAIRAFGLEFQDKNGELTCHVE